MRLSAEKGRLDRSLNTAEQELQEAQQQILMQQVSTLTVSSTTNQQRVIKLLLNPDDNL